MLNMILGYWQQIHSHQFPCTEEPIIENRICMKTIRDVRNWLTGLEQVVEDRVFLDQLRDMQIITRNIERDISDLFDERNKLIAENSELKKELERMRNESIKE